MKKLLKYSVPLLIFLFFTNIAHAASILTVPQGGTGASTFPVKRIIVSNPTKATGTLQSLAAGSDGTFLRASSTASSGFDFAAVSGSGTVTGTGINGFTAIWNTAVNITTGVLRDNGTVSGVNATSSTVSFNVQGSGALNPFNVSSSTGTMLLRVAPNGSTTISSLGTGLVRSSSGSLYTDTTNYLSSAITSLNGQTGATQVFATSSSGTVFDIQSSDNTHTFIFPSDPTFSTLNLTNTTNSGNLVYYNGSTLIGDNNGFNWDGTSLAVGSAGTHSATLDVSGSLRFNGQLLLDASAGTAGDFLVSNGAGVVPTWSSAASAGLVTTSRTINTTAPLTGGGNLSGDLTLALSTPLAVTYGGIGTTTLGNLTVSSSNLSITGGQQVLIGTSTQITLSDTPTFTKGTFTNASTTNLTASGNTYFTGLLSQNCLGTSAGGLLQAGSCGSGGAGTISTSSQVQIGKNATWTGLATLGNGALYDNGTVAGVNATSSTISFNVQGSTTLDPFNVSSSSGTSFLRVTQAGNVGVNTTSPTKAFEVWANQTGGVARITRETGTTILPATPYGVLDIRLTTSSSTLTTFPNVTGPALTFSISSSTNANSPIAIADIVSSRVTDDRSGGLTLRPYYQASALYGLTLSPNSWGADVAVNTSTAFATLYIQGGNGRNPFEVASSSGATILQITAGSEVLIDPTAKLRLPASSSQTLTTAGQIYLDTTAGQIQYHDGTAQRTVPPYWTKTFWLSSTTPTTSLGRSFGSGTTTISFMGFPTATTLTRLACQTETGTVNVQLGNGAASSTSISAGTSGASTTPTITLNADQSYFVVASSSLSTADGLRCTIQAYPTNQ